MKSTLNSVALAAVLGSALTLSCTKEAQETKEVAPPAAAEPAAPGRTLPTTLDEALKSEFRSADNLPRDAFRHPKETLEFFGLKPDMKVVEISPSKGWYAEILAPYLSAKGEYVAAVTEAGENEYLKKTNQEFADWYGKFSEVKVTTVAFDPAKPLAVENADMVLTFRNVHNWMGQGKADKAFKAFYAALKPGGILGVTDHRADKKAKGDSKAKKGYVKESDVIRFAEKAGFKLEGKSEINANPKDSKNYPEGVWNLPPTLKGGDKDRQKYVDIGESDRMTLKFVKPVKK